MKESLRTIVLFVLLAVAAGFIIWNLHQSEANLQSLAPETLVYC